MKILAIDTTGAVASVALVNEDITVGEFSTNYKKNHATTIMPMVSQLFEKLDMSLVDVDYIACASGPGSFTGLRIGVATAKALAHGSDKKVVPVPTLDALAYNVYDTAKLIVPIMDARRNQVYTALYKWQGGLLIKLTEYMAEDITEVLELVNGYGEQAVFVGDGVLRYKEEIIQNKQTMAPIHMNMQRGAAVGALALELIKEDKAIHYKDFVPFYLRKPQAEREYERNHGHV